MFLAALLKIHVEKRAGIFVNHINDIIDPNTVIIESEVHKEEELEHLEVAGFVKKRIENGQDK